MVFNAFMLNYAACATEINRIFGLKFIDEFSTPIRMPSFAIKIVKFAIKFGYDLPLGNARNMNSQL